MLPTLAEIQAAELAIAAYFADPAPAPVTPVAPPTTVARVQILPPFPVGPSINFIADGPNRWLLIINVKRNCTQYLVTEFAADGGRGFRFEKHYGKGTDATQASYDVFLADPIAVDAAGAYDSCDCKGFERHGHCKHIEAARAIADRHIPTCRKPAAARPVKLCSECRKRPTDGIGYQCSECEGRM